MLISGWFTVLCVLQMAIIFVYQQVHGLKISKLKNFQWRHTFLQCQQAYDSCDKDDNQSNQLGTILEKKPLDLFLDELKQSCDENIFIKLTLSENTSGEDTSGEEGNVSIIDTYNTNSVHSTSDLKAISARIIKTKSLNKYQIESKDISKSSMTENHSQEQFIQIIHTYLLQGFKKATMETKYTDFELNIKRGRGKFRSVSKGFDHLDSESVINQKITETKDPLVLRKILEDRRLLLLSDPKNQNYKILYAEAKRAVEMN